jgi:hypothetical protein
MITIDITPTALHGIYVICSTVVIIAMLGYRLRTKHPRDP